MKLIRLIDDSSKKPFFLYMSYYTVHTPIEAPPSEVAYFAKKVKPYMKHTNATYAAMVKNMDKNVGRILKSLDTKGLADNTIVIFASDNGGFSIPWRHFPVITNNAPLRSGKGSLYEGGVRIPLIIRWPNLTVAGSVSHEPVALIDLYPTLISATGLSPTPGASRQDAINLLPVIENADASLSRDALYWHYPHYYPTTTPVSSIRSGNWKLLEFLEDNRLELYNLNDDPGEQDNQAKLNPEKTDELRNKLFTWRINVNAQMPTKK